MAKPVGALRVTRAGWYRIIGHINTFYPHKMLLYMVMLAYSTATIINDIWFSASWDILSLNKFEYIALNMCMILAPLGSILAGRVRHHLSSLWLSVSCDAATAFALFAYSMMVMHEFGAVLTCGVLWSISASLIIYSLSDVKLLRLIATQPIPLPEQEVDNEMAAERLKAYVGVDKWESLVESARAINLLLTVEPTAFNDDR